MRTSARRVLLRSRVLILVASACLAFDATAGAQPAAQGPFTEAQAARGARLADTHCGACHDPRRGGTALPFSGERFMQKWGGDGRTADDLFYIARTSMPFGAPGSLTPQEYADIVAHILRENGYAAGRSELLPATEALVRVRLESRLAGAGAARSPSAAAPVSVPPAVASSSGAGGAKVPSMTGPTQVELNRAATDRANWLLANHDYGGQRFVEAVRIRRENVGSLAPVCMYQFGDNSPFHTNPIVYQGVLYATTTLATVAIDAATCRVKWRHDWKPKQQLWPQNRGIAIKEGRVVRGTTDGFLLALDARTGDVLWERAVADASKGETFTMSPLVFEDLVIVGPAGAEAGIRGWVGAFRLSNGEPVWRFNTVPAPGEPGSETWGGKEAHVGGGAVWAPFALDAEAGRVYLPVSNPAPDLFSDARPGANLYTNSMLVLDARTGKRIWHFQAVPHDVHDWDATQASPLFSTLVLGKRRNLVAVGGKHGLLHVLDRDTQQQLYAVAVTTRENVEAPVTVDGVRACPGILGGIQWSGPAFNPLTGLLYVPAVDWCATFTKAKELRFVPGQMYMGGSATLDPVEKSRGWLTAIDAATGAIKWRYESRRPMLAAVTTTAAGLVFTGELEGDFLALDAADGRVLYRFNTGGRLNGGLVTYEIDDRQYVAVASGNASPFWRVSPASATIVVFGLPERAAATK
jgi:alcohol dehydrogenase (cytochrome c)